MRHSDVLVVGAGMAGLMAAVTAAKSGASVSVLSEGAGVISIGSGAVDFLGYVNGKKITDNPFNHLSELGKEHPYNIIGAENVIEAAIDAGVKKVVALSTDKAANPINLYGATKLASDKLFVAGNAYAGGRVTKFSVVRYGNVLGSRGSVLPLFLEQKKKGVITITNRQMTRFWITIEQAIELVIKAFHEMEGGEIFVPKIPSATMEEFAKIIAPECKIEDIGIRPGEKMHEVMIPSDDSRHTLEFDDHYRIMPEFRNWENSSKRFNGKVLPEGFCYSSDNNPEKINPDFLRKMAEEVQEKINDMAK